MTRPQRAIRTQAIILKRQDLGEADRLLTLLTPNAGKLSAVAKGARKPNSAKTGHVELYTRADVLLHKGRDLDILVQAEVVEPFLPLREDLLRGAYAHYAVELLDRFTESGDDDLRRAFILLRDIFQRLCVEEELRLPIRYYEMHLLDALGFRPELLHCVVSREPILPQDQFFSAQDGGVVSPEYCHLSAHPMPISMNALKLLRHLQRSRYDTVRTLKVPPAVHDEAERVMLAYITYLLERRLQSVDFLKRIRRPLG